MMRLFGFFIVTRLEAGLGKSFNSGVNRTTSIPNKTVLSFEIKSVSVSNSTEATLKHVYNSLHSIEFIVKNTKNNSNLLYFCNQLYSTDLSKIMLDFLKKFKFLGIILAILSVIIITIFYNLLKVEKQLPVYQPASVNVELVDSTIQYKKKYHRIADFSLTNQNGKTITQDDYKDKIYVADFFFTTCQTICPIMTKNMHEVQKEFIADNEVMMLSYSVTPDIDTVAQLKRYAQEKGINASKWNLVTGDKKQIYELARKSYLAVKDDGNGGPFDMIHTENFMLIDKDRQIRGFYDGTDLKEIDRLLDDIQILKEVYHPSKNIFQRLFNY
jgi:protein SCO1